jgi:hypothetical protein
MMATNLIYTKFKECMIEYETIRLNLPNEHNLREELCKNLNVEATRLGYLSEARLFRLEEVKAREENLWAAVLWKTEWYRRHYYGARRFRVILELGWSYVNRLLWGCGERVYILMLNLTLFIFLVVPLLFSLLAPELLGADDHGLRWYDLIYLSIQTVLPVDLGVNVTPDSLSGRVVVIFGSVGGLIFTGLFVAYLLRWILRR